MRRFTVSWRRLLPGVVPVLALLALLRFGDPGRLVAVIRAAEPEWILAAAVFQILTYRSAGRVWAVAVRAAGVSRVPHGLTRLSMEKLAVDQLVPSGGMAGHLGALSALRRIGLPAPVAFQAVFLDIFSFYVAYVMAALVGFFVLVFRHDVSPAVTVALGLFGVLSSSVMVVVVRIVRHPGDARRLPRFLSAVPAVARAISALGRVAPEHVLAPSVVFRAAVFQSAVFLLDALTLWAAFRALGTPLPLVDAFAAFVIGSVAGTVSLIPAGVGTFEAAATAILVGLGGTLETALPAVLLYRALALWIPIVPGALMARRDFSHSARWPVERS